MVKTSRHETWQAADHYEAYMGRRSRQIARRFLDGPDAGSGLDWLDAPAPAWCAPSARTPGG